MTKNSTILLFILICFCVNIFAQVDSIPEFNVQKSADSAHIQVFRENSSTIDTLPPVIAQKGIAKIATQQDLDDIVEYGSRDSTELDKKNQILHLWGDAYVNYQTSKINAHYIRIDLKNNIATAELGHDAKGRPIGKPAVDLEGQQVVANKLSFNFKTKKGIIHDGRFKQSDLYINGSKIKVIAGPYDSLRTDDVLYQEDALITTCNHPDAHFGIQASKMKIVPDRVAVIGPSYVRIGGVPTPLLMPFGFFPLKKTKQTGIIFPNDYNYSPQWGYGLKNIGYYLPVNDRMDLIFSGDVYLRGSHRIGVTTRYNRRYKYNGSVMLEYSTYYNEPSETYKVIRQTSYHLQINHNQDPKANPYNKFGGNANIQIGRFQTLNYNDANSVLNNNLSSNITYSRIFSGKPYSFSAAMSHTQQLSTRDFGIELPKLTFNTQSIFPFRNSKRVGDRWYDQISFTYSAELSNKIQTKDSLLFSDRILKTSKQGVRQSFAVTSSYKVLKYFNISPNFNYNEIWGFNTIRQDYDPTVITVYDTTRFVNFPDSFIVTSQIIDGRSIKDTMQEFGAFRTFNASVGINTQLFGLMQFRKGFIRGVRHQMRPSLSFAVAPDYSRYYDSVQTSNVRPIRKIAYNKYQEFIYGGPPGSVQQMGLSLSISNTLEAKVRGRKDTTDRKIKIFESFGVNTFYNFAEDSLKLKPLSYNATTRLFKGLSTITMNGSFDFYDRNSNDKKIDVFYWKTKGKPMRFVNFSATLNTSLTVEKIRKLLQGRLTESEAASRQDNREKTLEHQSFWDLLDNFTINHSLNLSARDEIGPNKLQFTTNSISMSGNIPITEKWAINIGYFGFDFKNLNIVYPDLGFSRDLHCWYMRCSWQPVRGTYSFIIGVKPGSLDFLKIPNNKNRADVFSDF
ncbi:MAG: LPS-assembly protein LptD [Saprospiraceae bacterium]|nr:MAG: organic solvent tolerance protein OstA [Candidatus Parvibacillus calidus]MCC7148410.1 LPS-assembly protein LptD [Saprospiraceae bacterium]